MDRGLIRWILIVGAVVLAALWLITASGTGATPWWVPPLSVLSLAIGVAIAVTMR